MSMMRASCKFVGVAHYFTSNSCGFHAECLANAVPYLLAQIQLWNHPYNVLTHLHCEKARESTTTAITVAT